jgi:hypothetical protein
MVYIVISIYITMDSGYFAKIIIIWALDYII